MNLLNWLYNKIFGCKCRDKFGYGTCAGCGKQFKRVDTEAI